MQAVAAGFTAMGGWTGTAATAASIISGAAAIESARHQGEAADLRADQLDAQSEQAELAAERETEIGRQQANSVRQELLANLASQRAAGGASGLTPESDAIQTGLLQATETGSRNIRRIRENALTRRDAQQMRRSQLRTEARMTRASGRATETAGLLQAFSGVAERGVA